ncbi:MAG TPA: hypothetical protein VGB86_13570 [Methylomirabilota bacterium]|jgi:hypothetical protein
MLRLKGEPDNEIRDEPLPEPSDRITSEDVFREDGIEEDESASGLLPPLPGPLIAAATFVPTFLAVFFGLSYLVGGTTPTASTPAPSAAARFTSDRGAQTPSLSEAIRDPFVAPSRLDPPAPGPVEPRNDPGETRTSDSGEPLRGWSAEDAPRPAAQSSGPTLPPAPPPAAEPRAPRRVEPPRQPQAAVPTTAPEPSTAEAGKTGRDWTPAAAFTDREAAGRLASSIQRQGYPVEIRQEQSSARPWVVWIGAQPRRGERRR